MSTASRHFLIFAASVASALGLYLVPALHAQDNTGPTPAELQQPSATCDFSSVPGAVWWGTEAEGRMSLAQLAAYIAPVYWFSPDEPLLNRAEGAEIRNELGDTPQHRLRDLRVLCGQYVTATPAWSTSCPSPREPPSTLPSSGPTG